MFSHIVISVGVSGTKKQILYDSSSGIAGYDGTAGVLMETKTGIDSRACSAIALQMAGFFYH
jgi:hypothetical protein